MDKSLITNLIYSKHETIYTDRFHQMLNKKLLVILIIFIFKYLCFLYILFGWF
jgi:hypothetical protein